MQSGVLTPLVVEPTLLGNLYGSAAATTGIRKPELDVVELAGAGDGQNRPKQFQDFADAKPTILRKFGMCDTPTPT